MAWRGAGMRSAVMKSRPRWPRTRRMRRIGRSAAHLILGGADGQRVDLRSGRAALRWLPTRSCCPDLTQTNCVASSRGRLRTINEPRTTPRRASVAFNHAPHAACGLFGARWAVRGVPCLRQLRVGGLGRPRQPAARAARPFCSECGPGVSPSPAADVDVGRAPVPAQMWAGVSPSPGADVGRGEPQSRRRCGRRSVASCLRSAHAQVLVRPLIGCLKTGLVGMG